VKGIVYKTVRKNDTTKAITTKATLTVTSYKIHPGNELSK